MGLCQPRQVGSEKNLPNPATGTSRALCVTATGLLPQLMIAALRMRRSLIPRGLHCGAPISTPGDRSLM